MKSLIIVLVSILGVFSKGLSSIGNEVKIEETEMLDDDDSLFSQVFDRRKGKNKKVCNKWKNCCKKFKEEAKERGLVITGGDNPSRLDSSVLISHLGLCSSPNIPALPETMSGGKSVWFENSLMFCGGSDIFEGFEQLPAGAPWGATDTCRKVKPGDLTWDSDPQFNMKEKRSWFSLNDNGKEIVAAGGLDQNGNIWNSLEKYSEGTWEDMGIVLDNPVYGHCGVHYTSGGDSFLMIIGGSDTFDKWWDPTATVTQINLSAGTQTILDSGPLPGLWAPACTRHGEDIYISGGGITNDSGDNGKPTSGVFKYNIEDGEFKHVGELNNPRWGHTMGVTDKDQLVVAGGFNLDLTDADVYLTSIEVSEVGDSWSEWSTALSNGAEYSAIASIPTKHLKCH